MLPFSSFVLVFVCFSFLCNFQALAKQLKEQLECSRKVRDSKVIASRVENSEAKGGAREDVAMLIRTDRQGLARPLPGPQYPVEPVHGRGKKKVRHSVY